MKAEVHVHDNQPGLARIMHILARRPDLAEEVARELEIPVDEESPAVHLRHVGSTLLTMRDLVELAKDSERDWAAADAESQRLIAAVADEVEQRAAGDAGWEKEAAIWDWQLARDVRALRRGEARVERIKARIAALSRDGSERQRNRKRLAELEEELAAAKKERAEAYGDWSRSEQVTNTIESKLHRKDKATSKDRRRRERTLRAKMAFWVPLLSLIVSVPSAAQATDAMLRRAPPAGQHSITLEVDATDWGVELDRVPSGDELRRIANRLEQRLSRDDPDVVQLLAAVAELGN